MECDCKPDSACTANSPCEQGDDLDKVITDIWINFNTVMTALLSVVGYGLYRFSQVLPALIRWPVRIICSLTGLSSLWNWVSRLVYTIRGLQTILRWLSCIWKFVIGLFSKLSWIPTVIKAIAGSVVGIKQCVESLAKLTQHFKGPSQSENSKPEQPSIPSTPHISDPRLRMILVGPWGTARHSVGDSLLGCKRGPSGLDQKCTTHRAEVDGWDVTVVQTPDLLGSSLSMKERGREALRSIQLASPGPHAFLLVLPITSTGEMNHESVDEALMVLSELFGESAMSHVLVVLVNVSAEDKSYTLVQLLEEGSGTLREALSMCGQRAELIDMRPGCSVESRVRVGQKLRERVVEMRAMRGHYTHELQRREDRIREELLEDMADVLAQKLGLNGR